MRQAGAQSQNCAHLGAANTAIFENRSCRRDEKSSEVDRAQSTISPELREGLVFSSKLQRPRANHASRRVLAGNLISRNEGIP
jgi:hypothetical protein